MAHIVRESIGLGRQDPDHKVYTTKNPARRIKGLFLELLRENDFSDEYIANAKYELKEYDEFEDDRAYCYGYEAMVQTDDCYRSKTYLNVVE